MDDIRKFPSVFFQNWSCRVIPALYMNNVPALQLREIDDGTPIATASVNLEEYENYVLSLMHPDGYPTGEQFTFIKDWSENQGILSALTKAKIVSEPVEIVSSGYIEEIPLVKVINEELSDELYNLRERKENEESKRHDVGLQ